MDESRTRRAVVGRARLAARLRNLERVTISRGALTFVVAILMLPALAAAQPANKPEARADEPMTAGERVDWIVDGTIGLKSLTVVGPIGTAWQTAWNTPSEWGQTWSGAGKRYAQRLADVAISNTIEAGLGALWGERANYIRSHKQGVKPRLGYALKTVFLAYRPDGHLAPAWGRYAGNTVNNLIENTWLPPSVTTWQQTTWRSASGFGTRALGNVWEEFWPDVSKRLLHRKE